MHIKKYIVGILSILLCLTLVGCNSNAKDNEVAETNNQVIEYNDIGDEEDDYEENYEDESYVDDENY